MKLLDLNLVIEDLKKGSSSLSGESASNVCCQQISDGIIEYLNSFPCYEVELKVGTKQGGKKNE